MLFGSALFGALFPQSSVEGDYRGHKVVGLIQTLGWKSDGAQKLVAEVGVVLDRFFLAPGPDISKRQNVSAYEKDC